MFCAPLHLLVIATLRSIISLHLFCQLIPACRQPPPLVPGLHRVLFFFCCCFSAKRASTSCFKISPCWVQVPKIFCQVTVSNFCCNKQILSSFGLSWLNGSSVAYQKGAHKSFSIQCQSCPRVKGSLNVVGPCRENQQGWTSQAKKRLY